MTPTPLALAALVGLALCMGLYWVWRRPAWTGFAGRTLWDWLPLMAMPMVVGLATLLINSAQQSIANDRAAEAAFQQYIDRVTALILTPPDSAAPETVNAIGRAHTVAVLRLVEGERAGRVLAFLAETDLLARFSIPFEGIDLTGAELKDIRFGPADFEGAILPNADLEGVECQGADFESADLTGADMKGANLRGAEFERTQLARADLSGANLRGADLSQTLGLKTAQLEQACYDTTTALPAGMAHDGGESEGCRMGVVDDD